MKGNNETTAFGEAGYDEPGLCSEEDVINFTFKVCDTESTGRVAASVIIQYLREMTGQGTDGRLQVLHNMLDPERKDVAVDQGSFHLTMRRWIANCTQDGPSDEKASLNLREDPRLQSTERDEISHLVPWPLEEGMDDPKVEATELINKMADLKYANKKLREQNNSLQKALELSDETNLQLTKELTKVKNQLISSQRTLRSMHSMVEELEDARSAGRDARERVHQLGTQCKELKKEKEALVAQLWSASGKIEKLERDKRELKYQIDELLTQKADLTKQIHEAQNQLISKDTLIFEGNIMIEEMKTLKAESCKVIEGLRAELKRSQGKICQDFFSCKLGVSKSSPGLPLNRPIWSPTSLQVEIRETQKLEGCEGLPDPVCGLVLHKDRGDHLQEILTHIKAKRQSTLFQRTVDEMVDQLNVHAAAFMTKLRRMETGQQLNVQDLRLELEQTMQAVVQKLHLLAPVKDSWDENMEALAVACAQCQQDYINAKQNLANTVRELELEKVLREEAEEQAAEAEQRAEEAWLEAKPASGRSLASRELKEAWADVGSPGQEARVTALQASGRPSESEQKLAEREEQSCSLELQVRCLNGEADAESGKARREMAEALQAAEAKSSEVARELEEQERVAAAAIEEAKAEGGRAVRCLAEAEGLREEVERLKLQAAESLLDSTWRMRALEEQVATLSQELVAAQQDVFAAQDRAAAAEVRLLAAILGHPGTEGQRKATAAVAGETEQKQETDVLPLSQEIFELLHHQRLSTHSGWCNNDRPGQNSSLLEALNLELSGSHQLLGTQKRFRPLSFDQSRGEEGKPSSPKESLTKGEDSETTGRNSVGGSRSQELDVKHRLSPEAEEQLPPTTLPEDEDLASVASLRQLLNNFSLAGLEPSLIRGARCVIAPNMPTLPEEEVGPEDQEATQNTKLNVLAAGTGMNTPAIVLPEVTGPSDKESDRATHLRCPSPIQRKSSRNSRASLSSASSLTSVDGDGHVYDLVNDQLPDVELSDEDRKKNTELLEEAKKISERFLSRRSRRSRTSVSDSPPAVTPSQTPTASPSPIRSNSVIALHLEPDMPAVQTMAVLSLRAGEEDAPSPIRDKEMKLLEVPGSRQQDAQVKSEQHTRKLSPARKAIENRKPSPGAIGFQLSAGKVVDTSVHRKESASLEVGGCSESKPLDKNRHSTHVKGAESALAGPTKSRSLDRKMIPVRSPQVLVSETGAVRTSIEHSVPRPRTPCTAEIKSLSSQPLLRAVSWECLEVDGELSTPPSPPLQAIESFSFNVLDNSQHRSFDCKDLPVEPKLQKLTKLREENKLMRSQNLSAQRLPDLSETSEQERGHSPVPCPAANGTHGSSDATPSIPDSLLWRLKVQRTLPAGLPPLTEKEVENTFVQLSLAFKNDSYTLEARLGLAERERNLAEDNTQRELENFKSELKSSASLWVNSEQREAQERLLETVAVLQRLAIRLSGRAEMVGAVRQEKRMSKATEVMMQYVDNLKRMYEKDHAELTEFKKLANQNSNRSYSPYGDSGDDGVPRTARSMSLTLGKSVPRRRVSVAVLPKFINFPGQPASSSAIPTVAPVMESNNNTGANTAGSASSSSSSEAITSTTSTVPSSSSRTSSMLAPLIEMKQNADKEVEQTATGTVCLPGLDLTKAKIEEEAFNKGYQEGLKAQLSQDQKELRHETGKAEGASEGPPAETSLTEGRKASKLEEVAELIVRLCLKPVRHRSVMWLVAAIVLLLAVLSSIFTSLRSPCEQAGGSPSAKGSCLPSGHSSAWPFWRLWHRNRVQA